MDLVAFDFAGFSNKASTQVTITIGGSAPITADKLAPKIITTAIKVTKNQSGLYLITLPLEEPSGLLRGNITRNGVTLYEFRNGNTANFTMDSLGPVVVSAQDTAKNTLNQTVDLNTYFTQ